MPICCVDTFVYHFEKRAYLMIQRTAPPAKGLWWMPGGRVLKGESFYESAIRKVKIESGLDICPIAKLSTYSTYFPESAWDVHTDTKNTVILALCDNEYVANTEHLNAFKWVPIKEAPGDPYMFSAYKEAKEKLKELGFDLL
jgi:ADP-ribose pyrophosphatase YjhB (NUDIX family)